MAALAQPNTIFVDCTATDGISGTAPALRVTPVSVSPWAYSPLYSRGTDSNARPWIATYSLIFTDLLSRALDGGAGVVFANKKILTGPSAVFDHMTSPSHTGR